MGWSAKAGTPEAEGLLQQYQAEVDAQTVGAGVRETGRPQQEPQEPKLWAEEDYQMWLRNEWTTGNPDADRAIQGIASLTSQTVGATEFAFDLLYNTQMTIPRLIFGKENIPEPTDLPGRRALAEVNELYLDVADRPRRGANAYFDNKGFIL